ncbi:MAG: DNA circularization N-terminal domain-containing protein [Alphaproteobacteria bacterium]|nr:DNA circularization N-terminal domain-containing protein [Alphaproteobacteria bacterium]
MGWIDYLQPASFRGVPFSVLNETGEFGRRIALHEYPKRDIPYPEDMGRRSRRFQLQGYLVGDDVLAQREVMVGACEQSGDGVLIHPSYGRLTVTLMGPLRAVLKSDRGRYVELNFDFVESGQRIFPSAIIATGDAVSAAADAADGAASTDFATTALSSLKQGASVVQRAVGTVAIWARQAQQLGNNATNLSNMVSSLPGNFGRYAGGKSSGGLDGTVQSITGSTTSINQLILQGTQSRTSISNASASLTTIANGLGL